MVIGSEKTRTLLADGLRLQTFFNQMVESVNNLATSLMKDNASDIRITNIANDEARLTLTFNVESGLGDGPSPLLRTYYKAQAFIPARKQGKHPKARLRRNSASCGTYGNADTIQAFEEALLRIVDDEHELLIAAREEQQTFIKENTTRAPKLISGLV